MSDSCDFMGGSLPGSSVHGILQARILERVAISFSRGSSRPRNQTFISCMAGRFFTDWAMRKVHKFYSMLNFKTLPQVEEASHTPLNAVLFHSCQISKTDPSIGIEQRSVVDCSWREVRNEWCWVYGFF